MANRLTQQCWWFDLRGVNAYLVADGDALTLIDTGNPWDAKTLRKEVAATGYAMREIDRVLLTHYDMDHVGTLGRLVDLDAPIYIGEGDAPFLRGEQRPRWRNRKAALQRLASPVLKEVPEVELVADGDELGSFTAYHTPGHTPGHVAYVSETLSTAFLGDLVVERHGRLEPSPYLLSYDDVEVERSIKALAHRAPQFDVAAMGHGVPFLKDGAKRLDRLAATL
ncbi:MULTISPECIES: MBL fold metallo-hydrolase [unclassified Haladaptatus]|uniref:MBL fold metallo-hydrolase n=1 Tax=unclassified Haladaptatus TaxID=2622732 RepID=UPI0023E88FC7|nr:MULTISPECIES: MBL fold metallo-hydrolase [unclassified Haladaptatus]